MSLMSLIIVLLGFLATLLFGLGYLRGVQNALNSFRQVEQKERGVPQNGHWYTMALATLASAVIIATVGITADFVYAGPLLALVSAAGTGVAFLLEEKVTAPSEDDAVGLVGPEKPVMAANEAD